MKLTLGLGKRIGLIMFVGSHT